MLEFAGSTMPPLRHIGRSSVYVIFAVPNVERGRARIVEHCGGRPRDGRGFICPACLRNCPMGMVLVDPTRLRQLSGDPKLGNAFDTRVDAVAAALNAQFCLDENIVE